MKNFTLNFNKKVMNVSYTMYNDKLHGFSFDLTAEYYFNVTKLFIYFKLSVPENYQDTNFKREYYKTVFDVEKAMKGMQRNFMVNLIIDMFTASRKFEFKMPLTKVDKFEKDLERQI
jgi:hypothetical protein